MRTMGDGVKKKKINAIGSCLHDSVPVVPGGDAEEGEEGHAEGTEVRVLAQALARVLLVAT